MDTSQQRQRGKKRERDDIFIAKCQTIIENAK
jgi:hypothetical protein